jgi:hypothetical protein
VNHEILFLHGVDVVGGECGDGCGFPRFGSETENVTLWKRGEDVGTLVKKMSLVFVYKIKLNRKDTAIYHLVSERSLGR